MVSKIAIERLQIEFGSNDPEWLLNFLEQKFFKNQERSWSGSVVYLDFEPESQTVNVQDQFCEWDDQRLTWEELKTVATSTAPSNAKVH